MARGNARFSREWLARLGVLRSFVAAVVVIWGGAAVARAATTPKEVADTRSAAGETGSAAASARFAAALRGLPPAELAKAYVMLRCTSVTQEEAERLFGRAHAAVYLADEHEVRMLVDTTAMSAVEEIIGQANGGMGATALGVAGTRQPLTARREALGQTTLMQFANQVAALLPETDAEPSKQYLVKYPSMKPRPEGAAPVAHVVAPKQPENATNYYIYQDFEGDVWSYWQRGDNTGGRYTWAVKSCNPHGGYYSADPVRGGSQGALLSCASYYPASVETWMYTTLCDTIPSDWKAWMFGYLTGTMGMSQDDRFNVYLADAQNRRWGYGFYGNWPGWWQLVFNLKQWWYLGDVTTNYCNTLYLDFESSSASPAGSGMQIDDVEVYYGPTADVYGGNQIVADPVQGPAPLTVAFRGITDLYSATYYWDFGDGTTSSAKDPVHIFTSPGTHYVYFRVSSSGVYGFASSTITVNPGATCSYGLSTNSQSFAAGGGSGSVSVTTTSSCTWTAWSNANWITITGGAGGTGNGTVTYSVAPNSGLARSGTMTVAGKTFTVNQDALSCYYSISPSSGNLGAAGGTGSFAVNTAAACGWAATSDSTWLRVTGGVTGSGTGTVYYVADANSGPARTGHITVQDQTFTATETSGVPSLSFAHWIAAVSHTDGFNNSHWRSDVAVLNRSSSTATVEYRLYSPEGLKTRQVTLPGNAQDFHQDIAAWLGYWYGSGSLEVRSDQDVFVMGRTYNQVDAFHTYGQNYDGQDPDSSLLAAGQSAWLPLLAQTVDYRCNIAITNSGTSTASVTLSLYDGQGNLLWRGSDESNAIPARGFIQYLQPFQSHAGRNDIQNGYAQVTVNSGSGIIVWASMMDENTGDPTTIFMKR